MRARIEQELALLQKFYPDIEHRERDGEDWFRLPRYPFPPGWQIGSEPVEAEAIVFKIVAAYPTGEPYAFAARAGITFKGAPPNNASSGVATPFEGSWQQFSWAPDGWTPTADPAVGSNLLAWVRSFAERLKGGT